MISKKQTRLRRSKRTRAKIKELQLPRLSVHRTPSHIYVQAIMPDGRSVASASTLDEEVKKECFYGGNVAVASIVGKYIAQRCKALNIIKVAFDRSGFRYHGRVRALADAAREHGLDF